MSPVTQSTCLQPVQPTRRRNPIKTAALACVVVAIALLMAPAMAQRHPGGAPAPAPGLAIPELHLQNIAVSPAKPAQGQQAATPLLVQARVVPLDPNGRVATNVRFESFTVATGGKPIPVRRVAAAVGTETHLSVALLLDVSGSMRGTRMKAARKAIALFLKKLQPADRVALITFGKSAALKQDFTTDKGKIVRAMDESGAVEDRTAIYDALELTTRIGWGAVPGNRAVVLLTDGLDNASRFTSDDTMHLVEKRGVPVYTIALGDANRATLARIATLSGGAAFAADNARDESALSDLYTEAWKHLAGGYIVEFSPPADTRRVQITWKRPDGHNPSVEADLRNGEPIASTPAPATNNGPVAKSQRRANLRLPLALGGAALIFVGAVGAGLLMRRSARQHMEIPPSISEPGQSASDFPPLSELLDVQNREHSTVTDWAANSGADLPSPGGAASAGSHGLSGGYRKGDTLVRPVSGLADGIASAWLVVVAGPQKGRQFTLSSEEVIVGRSVEAQVRLDADELVSRRHAKIKATPDGYVVVDLASTGGVMVNGSRVYQHTLQDDDRILLGQSELVFKTLSERTPESAV
jgi:VWFA-related protein